MSALNNPTIITREVKVKKDLTEVVAFMTGASQLGSWLSPVKSVDPRVGGRLEFRAELGFEHGGEYLVLDPPSHVVLATDKFGLIDARFEQNGANTIANLSFTKTGDDEFEKVIADTVTRFIAMVNYR
ncbi:MAG: SRPBCC domain-containing protein [Micrococcales bacterium]